MRRLKQKDVEQERYQKLERQWTEMQLDFVEWVKARAEPTAFDEQ